MKTRGKFCTSSFVLRTNSNETMKRKVYTKAKFDKYFMHRIPFWSAYRKQARKWQWSNKNHHSLCTATSRRRTGGLTPPLVTLALDGAKWTVSRPGGITLTEDHG
jgi:hypothetical protein